MANLKQPKLGQTILSLRQEKKITQEELVERCNVNVRTLQRIESGEVTPRESTLKIILDALEYDYKQVEETVQLRGGHAMLKLAWISGIIYFVTGFLEAFLDFYRFEVDLPVYFSLLYTAAKTVILAVYIFFMLGFVELGKRYKQSLLKISAYLMLSSMAILEFYDVISLSSGLNEEEFFFVKGIESVVFAGINIVFGIALFKLSTKLGEVSKVAGLLEIAAGMFFFTFVLAFVGLFFLVPATLLEIVLLYKVYDQYTKQLQSDTE